MYRMGTGVAVGNTCETSNGNSEWFGLPAGITE